MTSILASLKFFWLEPPPPHRQHTPWPEQLLVPQLQESLLLMLELPLKDLMKLSHPHIRRSRRKYSLYPSKMMTKNIELSEYIFSSIPVYLSFTEPNLKQLDN
jgi:hypothetical protein